jgi:hypothetical protein
MGPPEGVLPGIVAMELVLARNARAVVFVGHLEAYPTGLALQVRVLMADDESLDPSPRGLGPPPRSMRQPGEPRQDRFDEMLRFGVELSDGSKAANVGGWTPREEGEPDGPVLLAQGGSGGRSRWDKRFWLWPLPPPGPVSFVCEWPSADLALSRSDIDARLVIDAAARALTVFKAPDGP